MLDNETGKIVPPIKSHKLTEAINYLLMNNDKRVQFSNAAKLWISRKFKAQDMVLKTSNLYKELLYGSFI